MVYKLNNLKYFPDQMILQIHESIGHPLELDRILGDERNYAGSSFVNEEMFGNYKSSCDSLPRAVMHAIKERRMKKEADATSSASFSGLSADLHEVDHEDEGLAAEEVAAGGEADKS